MQYDGETDALHLILSDAPAVESEEAKPGIILDLGQSGRVIGVDVLRIRQALPDTDPCKLELQVA